MTPASTTLIAPAEGASTVELTPSGKTFVAAPGQSLLDAGLAAGLALPYQCRTGECGTCRATVVDGEVDHLPASWPLAEGECLLCRCTARGPLRIGCEEVAGVSGLPLRKLAVRVASIERAAADVAVLRLQPPAGQTLDYLAGQYVDVLLRDGRRRSYSLATAPGKAEQLELHIRHLPGGAFTDQVFGSLKVRDMLRIEGPFGRFHLREDSAAPMILLASGTGFAPIKAIVEQARRSGLKRPATLYWGGRRRADLYFHAMALQWARELPWLDYVPVLSMADADWVGRSGFVHEAVIDDFPDLSAFEVYACGAPVMVDAARRDFVARCGLAEGRFFADAFVSAAPVAG